MIDEALDRIAQTGEFLAEAECHRVKGKLLLKQGADEAEVEHHYQKAIEVARAQKAKWWELRATVSLARLWQSQGRITEAREQLSEIYNWFAEGFDTVDLQEAKALLDGFI